MKEKITLEYSINSSQKILFNRLSTPGGLSEWFADDVNLKNNSFTFIWDNSESQANMVLIKENKLIRFRWIGDDSDYYFEFKISTDEITKDVALIITDFTEPDEKDDTIALWNSQIAKLKHAIGL